MLTWVIAWFLKNNKMRIEQDVVISLLTISMIGDVVIVVLVVLVIGDI